MLALLSRTLSIYRDHYDDTFCHFSIIQSNNPFTMSNRRSCYPVRSARSVGSSPVDKALKLVSPSRSQRHTVYGQTAFDAFSRFSSMIPSSPTSLFSMGASKGRNTILFYDKDKPYFNFTNFSPHSVDYNGKTYPTSEHLFQALKFMQHRPDLAEHIRTFSDKPATALKEARRFQPEVRNDWMSVNKQMMDEALRRKFTQHPALQQELLGTGDAELIEDSPIDAFWGNGPDGRGQNELGKSLMKLRTTLRASTMPAGPPPSYKSSSSSPPRTRKHSNRPQQPTSPHGGAPRTRKHSLMPVPPDLD